MTKADQDEKAVNVSLGMNVFLCTGVSVYGLHRKMVHSVD